MSKKRKLMYAIRTTELEKEIKDSKLTRTVTRLTYSPCKFELQEFIHRLNTDPKYKKNVLAVSEIQDVLY